jgi:hypothetical protein
MKQRKPKTVFHVRQSDVNATQTGVAAQQQSVRSASFSE